ncbi:MAG: TIGR00295 family protein [Candidatus Syntropharchaeia archaeon]
MTKRDYIRILKKAGCGEDIIEHSIVVADLALELSEKNDEVDRDLVLAGALLHDIGRCKSHGIDHGVIGGEIARKLGFDERIARIIERHVGAGIRAKEAKALGLPERDFVPETMEEKIVAHADNLVDGTERISIEERIERMKKKFGNGHPLIKRMINLHREVVG